MTRRRIAAGLTAVALSVACGATGPSEVPEAQGGLAAVTWAPDLAAVTEGIVEELRAAGLDAVAAERFGGEPFSVGMQRVAIRLTPNDSIYLYVYRTAELAAEEASRITPDGNVRPVEGPARVHVDYVGRQHFHYRDRVIARHGGCDATVRMAMETLFGAPLVVTPHTCR